MSERVVDLQKNTIIKTASSPQIAQGVIEHNFWVPGDATHTTKSFIDHVLIKRRNFINLVNYLNFRDRKLLLHVLSDSYDLIIQGYPLPCEREKVRLILPEQPLSRLKETFFLAHILIDEGKDIVVLPTERIRVSPGHLAVPVVHRPYKVTRRSSCRYEATDIYAKVDIGSKELRGTLIEFSSEGCRIKLHKGNISSEIARPGSSAVLTLASKNRITLKTRCQFIRLWNEEDSLGIVVKPSSQPAIRLPSRKVRNPRISIHPPPTARFLHPLSSQHMQLEVTEVGFSGFSVIEPGDEAVLTPGLVIDQLELCFPGSTPIKCSAQVIHRGVDPEIRGQRFGFSILDLGINDYTKLSRILYRTLEPGLRLSGDFSPEDLWDLFFSVNFLYPDKYAYVQADKQSFRATHEKVCGRDTEVAQSFVYQRGRRIFAHIGLLRAYEESWMLHHHAARPVDQRLTGFWVLKNAMFYLNDLHRYPSANMKFAICYFRPQNRFPRQAFGGFAKHLNNEGGCSLHEFSYFLFPRRNALSQLPRGWTLQPLNYPGARDMLGEISQPSFRLLFKSLGVLSPFELTMDLEAKYARHQMVRRVIRELLYYKGQPWALVVSNRSEPGINFSGLLNCIIMIVLPQCNHRISPEAIYALLGYLCSKYTESHVPVLCFPPDVIASKKRYSYWVLDVNYGDEFMQYMKEKFKL